MIRAEPRPGPVGAWDRLVGPGATAAENGLILGWTAVCAAAVVVYAAVAGLGWTPLQLAVAILFAADIGGGVPANTTDTAKRWYHRPGRGFRQHFAFALGHVHPFVLALVFPGFGWGAAVAVYGYLLAAAALLLMMPGYLRRPLALVLAGVGILGGLALDVPAGLEWFVPLFYLKLLAGHLVPESAVTFRAGGSSTG